MGTCGVIPGSWVLYQGNSDSNIVGEAKKAYWKKIYFQGRKSLELRKGFVKGTLVKG